MSEVTAVPVGNRGEQPFSIIAGLQGDLGDARKVLAQFVPIFSYRRAEFVEPDLLKKVNVLFRPFAGIRVTGVIKPRAIGVPGRAAATGGILDAWDDIRK